MDVYRFSEKALCSQRIKNLDLGNEHRFIFIEHDSCVLYNLKTNVIEEIAFYKTKDSFCCKTNEEIPKTLNISNLNILLKRCKCPDVYKQKVLAMFQN